MKDTSSPFSNEKGLTLIEILASLVILSIITISIMPMFFQSSRSNNLSKDIIDSTYLAKSEMEEIINLNNISPFQSLDDLSTRILKEGYKRDLSCNNCYGINKKGHYVFIQLKGHSEQLGKVILKIYESDRRNKQEAQMEMIFSWQK